MEESNGSEIDGVGWRNHGTGGAVSGKTVDGQGRGTSVVLEGVLWQQRCLVCGGERAWGRRRGRWLGGHHGGDGMLVHRNA